MTEKSKLELQQESIGNIAQVIKTAQAFSNPYSLILNSVNSKISNTRATVEAAAIGTPIQLNASQILAAIDSIEETLGRFGVHTNNLSGVDLSNGLTGFNFASLSSIVAIVQKYEDDNVCGFVNGVFGAIVNLGNISNAINILIKQLDELENSPELIAGYLDILKNLLENQIEQDLINFTNAQLLALQYAAASALNQLINNPCISEIVSVVGTQELKKVLIPKIQQIF